MRFPEFLRTTVLICAAAATVLGAVTLAGASGANDDLLLPFAAGWWAVAGLLVVTVGAGAVAFLVPQVPAVATGFAIIWALAWRRQASAVTAIEERDGARFYVEQTSPLQPIRLVRTPGFRSNLFELNGHSGRRPAHPRT